MKKTSTDQRESIHYVRLISILIFLAVVLLGEALIFYGSQNSRIRSDTMKAAFAQELRARADRELNSLLYLTSGLVGYLSVSRSRLNEEEISHILSVVYSDAKHIRNFGVAIGYELRYVYPRAGNEKAIGLDYRNVPRQWPGVKQAIDSGQGVLAGPVALVQGGEGFIYRKAIYIDHKYWGLLSTVLDAKGLSQAAFGDVPDDSYEFAVRSATASDGMVWGDPQVFQDPSAVRLVASTPGGHWEYAVRSRNGENHTALIWATRAALWLVALIISATALRLLRHRVELARLSMTDSLTGLANRRLFMERLTQAIYRHHRNPRAHCGILFIDLNGFKGINDRYGHKAGDFLLTTLAARISAELRTSDTLARLGGDEFAVILEETNIGQIDTLIDRLRALIAEPVAMDGDKFGVAASIGLACYPEDGGDPDVLLRLADEKMYSDKLRQKTNGV